MVGLAGAVIAVEAKAIDNPGSVLVLIWKPLMTASRAVPSFNPVSVMVMADVPVAAPAVVSTIEVFVAVAAGPVEVAVKEITLLAIDVTDPKK